MDYYETLGVKPDATIDDIKRRFKSLAMKHHPDRGGDQELFKNISAAYEVLSDSEKRQQYDDSRMGNPFWNHQPNGDSVFDFVFRNFHHQPRKNRDLSIHCQITLKDAYLGKEMMANYRLPNGEEKSIMIKIPAGILHGTKIHYTGMGDNTEPNLPTGDLEVTIIVVGDDRYARHYNDLYTNLIIDPIDAMIGTTKVVKSIDDREFRIKIPAGTQSGTELSIPDRGFTNKQVGPPGRFIVVVNVKIPKVIDSTLIEKLTQLQTEINR